MNGETGLDLQRFADTVRVLRQADNEYLHRPFGEVAGEAFDTLWTIFKEKGLTQELVGSCEEYSRKLLLYLKNKADIYVAARNTGAKTSLLMDFIQIGNEVLGVQKNTIHDERFPKTELSIVAHTPQERTDAIIVIDDAPPTDTSPRSTIEHRVFESYGSTDEMCKYRYYITLQHGRIYSFYKTTNFLPKEGGIAPLKPRASIVEGFDCESFNNELI